MCKARLVCSQKNSASYVNLVVRLWIIVYHDIRMLLLRVSTRNRLATPRKKKDLGLKSHSFISVITQNKTPPIECDVFDGDVVMNDQKFHIWKIYVYLLIHQDKVVNQAVKLKSKDSVALIPLYASKKTSSLVNCFGYITSLLIGPVTPVMIWWPFIVVKHNLGNNLSIGCFLHHSFHQRKNNKDQRKRLSMKK